MILKSLYLNNFRNYDELEVNFHENLNVIYGNNGNGKTNLVEAIIYLSNLNTIFSNVDFIINKQISPFPPNKKEHRMMLFFVFFVKTIALFV